MKLNKLNYDATSALSFYEESLSALGALTERTWHDRLDVIAEGRAAKLWNEEGKLHQQELLFAAPDATGARNAEQEVFPGCPLTFRLFEALRPMPLTLEKVVLPLDKTPRPPDMEVLEKLWKTQHPATRRWRLTGEMKTAFHFSLVALVRCEIQAIDQHWSLHRLAISLPDGAADESLARDIELQATATSDEPAIPWPPIQLPQWWTMLGKQIDVEMEPEIAAVRSRQQLYLQRELQRLDEYFAQYEKELTQRTSRATAARTKSAERLAAARTEHARRRQDQVARHEICIHPHVDALLLTAEPCWQANLEVEEQRATQVLSRHFVPRARRWFGVASESGSS